MGLTWWRGFRARRWARSPASSRGRASRIQEETISSWSFSEGDDIAPELFALRLLGGGNAYEAYLAWDERLLSLVVVKIVRPHLVDHSNTLRMLRREAGLLERLNHPVVVRGFGAVLEGPRPHLVLEYLLGAHLARLIRRHGALSVEQLLPLALELCSALHYLATAKVVHLDVKPRNVVMGAPPRLIDLSVARTFEQARKVSGYIGTDLYMAPEQCEPERGDIGPASDVWGLGVTLYAAAAGKKPFERPGGFDVNDREQRFPQLWMDPPALGSGVPRDLAAAIAACLARDPNDRPAAAEVAASLESMVAQLPRRPVLRRRRPRLR